LIDFRYHIVSLIAVFLALALGLFLGSTTLQSTVTNNLHRQANRVISENARLQAQVDQLNGSVSDERNLIAALGPYAIAGRLPGLGVAVVSAPGVSSDERSGLTGELTAAGATVTAQVQLTSAYLDPTQDAELGGLAEQLRAPGHSLPTANGSTEISAVLAAVLAERPGHKPVGRSHVEATLSALADGKFLSVTGNPPTHPATLALLLLPSPSTSTSPATAQAQNTVLLALAAQLRRVTTGLVVAGATATPPVANGALAAISNDDTLAKTVSTVDLGTADQDATAGRVAVVLALADLSGKPGRYGLGQSPPLPSASPSP
jgi:copper transport outer membrane protein MctB